MNKTRDLLLEPNPYNNHGIHWKAVQSFINEYTEKYGGVYGPRRDSDGVLYVIRNIRYQAFEKGDKQLGWNDIGIYLGPADYLAYQVRRAEDPRFVEWIYQKKDCPECGVETAWETGIKHSRLRCRKCELALQREWNSRASRNYRRRTGQVIHRSTAKCEQCGKEFTPKRSTAKFCSSFCRGMHFRNQKASKDERD